VAPGNYVGSIKAFSITMVDQPVDLKKVEWNATFEEVKARPLVQLSLARSGAK